MRHAMGAMVISYVFHYNGLMDSVEENNIFLYETNKVEM